METLLLDEVLVPARPHALPFRIMIEELRRRREKALLGEARALPYPWTESPEWALRCAIDDQEAAYTQLDAADGSIRAGTRNEPLDALLRECQRADNALKGLLHRVERTALCLSGGGIRSASFSLGVMEGLARFSRTSHEKDGGVMDRFDYLSTVSGGGYIGSWLMTWVYRRQIARTQGDPEARWSTTYRDIVSALAGREHISSNPRIPEPVANTGGDPEPQAVRHLRSYTSFLAPMLGATLDTATLIAIVFRNLIVNWAMLLPLLFALVSGARGLGAFLLWWHGQASTMVTICHTSARSIDVWTLAIFLVAAGTAAISLPSHDSERQTATRTEAPLLEWRTYTPLLFVVAVLLGSTLLAVAQSTGVSGPAIPTNSLDLKASISEFRTETGVAAMCFLLVVASIAGAEGSRILSLAKARPGSPSVKLQVQRIWVLRARIALVSLACFVGGLLAAIGTSALLLVLRTRVYPSLLNGVKLNLLHAVHPQGSLFVVLAIPLTVAILMLTTTLLCALLGVFERDEDREWWARCGGAILGISAIWIAGQTLAFYGFGWQKAIWATVSGLVLAGLASFAGSSSVTPAIPKALSTQNAGKVLRFFSSHNLLLPVLGAVSVFLISIGIVALEEHMRCGVIHFFAQHSTYGRHFVHEHPDGGSALILFLAGLLLAVLLNYAININLFSLQGMYRMRLTRAYLGASNTFRRPDPFTGFDPFDSPRISSMPCVPGVPIHLINCTLNLTGTTVSAWRQRKAESFTFNPVVCGGWRVGFARTESYASRHNGTTVAAAMSISGSAFNPNMGYHSSPLLSLLMTFFNVRLGAWLPNPKWPTVRNQAKVLSRIAESFFQLLGRDAYNTQFLSQPGPRFALWPLVQELLGTANDSRAWVELTDGGHFENLGLYEMVMRRVKHIVVVDAGADATYGFEDLGNAIRKIQIDLGVPIEFPGAMPMTTKGKGKNLYCAVAKIRYGCVDQGCCLPNDDLTGTLIYIKPVLRGNEPIDVYQYARAHATFPHETTVNQFFNESQFESYRHLGSWVVDRITDASTTRNPAIGKWKRPLRADGSMDNLIAFAQTFQ